ncbi:MAG: anti-sigma factor family protein [Candidatus Sulfotelmatobacter sp.]
MACEAWFSKLDAYVDGELPSAEAIALAEHVKQCAGCAADALDRVQLKRSIAIAGKAYSPSGEFRARVTRSVSKKPQRGALWFWKPVLLTAGLLIAFAALGLYWNQRNAAQNRAYSELADMHVATLASAAPVDVISTDRHTVKPWFEGKLPFTFNLPELQGTEFTLLGGRVAYFEQAAGAHLIYQIRKHQVSVFIFQNRDNIAFASGAKPELSFTVETWSKDGLRYFVVGDVGAPDVEALSRLLKSAG